MHTFKLLTFCLLLTAVWSCSDKASVEVVSKSIQKEFGAVKQAPVEAPQTFQQPFTPFIVYQDKASKNRFTPSGYMPTGECIALDDGWQYDTKEGKTSVRVVYDVACSKQNRKWVGVYWQNPADNWGDRKGGYNLSGAARLSFWAKGELGGERIEEFRVGGIGANSLYPDTDSATIGPVILTNQWKQYSIDLRGKDLTHISGGFAWVANVEANPHHCTFYLDDIRYE
ncbi:MAG: hypothetical protein HQL20_08710 [Candidatus Omnitrophica bacterium]|nr:hypothetical protein [Candidatus Omnitrophota bacterium]